MLNWQNTARFECSKDANGLRMTHFGGRRLSSMDLSPLLLLRNLSPTLCLSFPPNLCLWSWWETQGSKKREFSRSGIRTILHLQAVPCGSAAAPCSWGEPRNCSPSMSNVTSSSSRAQDTRTWRGDLLVLVLSRAGSFPGLFLSSQPRYFPLDLLPYATVWMNHHFPRVPLPNLGCIALSGALPRSLGCQLDDHWDPSWQGSSLHCAGNHD